MRVERERKSEWEGGRERERERERERTRAGKNGERGGRGGGGRGTERQKERGHGRAESVRQTSSKARGFSLATILLLSSRQRLALLIPAGRRRQGRPAGRCRHSGSRTQSYPQSRGRASRGTSVAPADQSSPIARNVRCQAKRAEGRMQRQRRRGCLRRQESQD